MRRSAVPALVVATLLCASCFSPQSDINVANGGVGGGAGGNSRRGAGGGSGSSARGTVSGGSSGGGTAGTSSASGSTSGGAGSSGAASTSQTSAGSSGGGSSGGVVCGATGGGSGSSIIFDCTNVAGYSGNAGSCPADWMGSQILDFDTCSPICGASVEAQDPSGIAIAGTNQYSDPANGTFHFCVPVGQVFETTATATGYGTFFYGEIQGQLATDIPLFGMLSTGILSAFGLLIPGGLDPNRGALVAFVVTPTECTDPAPSTGWSMSLTDEDGGAYPDGGYGTLYINASGVPDPTATATSFYGVALLTNIDPNVAQYPTLHATNPSSSCQVVNLELGFTGRVRVGANILSEQGLFLR